MGACETTPITTHTGEPASNPSHPPTPKEAFLALNDRPSLAGIQLVRPRPLVPHGLRALQLDPARATAQTGSDEETPKNSHPQPGASVSSTPGQIPTAA